MSSYYVQWGDRVSKGALSPMPVIAVYADTVARINRRGRHVAAIVRRGRKWIISIKSGLRRWPAPAMPTVDGR